MLAITARGQEVLDLICEYKKNPTPQLKEKLIRVNTELVRKEAHKVKKTTEEPFADLEQQGFIGLIKAIDRFDPAFKKSFSTFAVPYIRGEMLHYLRDTANSVRIPRTHQDLFRKGEKVKAEALAQGVFISDETIVKKLGVSVSQWQAAKVANSNWNPIALDSFESEIELPGCEELAEDDDQNIYKLREAMDGLNPEFRLVIDETVINKASTRDTAKKIGCNWKTVAQVREMAIAELTRLVGLERFKRSGQLYCFKRVGKRRTLRGKPRFYNEFAYRYFDGEKQRQRNVGCCRCDKEMPEELALRLKGIRDAVLSDRPYWLILRDFF